MHDLPQFALHRAGTLEYRFTKTTTLALRLIFFVYKRFYSQRLSLRRAKRVFVLKNNKEDYTFLLNFSYSPKPKFTSLKIDLITPRLNLPPYAPAQLRISR